MSRQYAVTNTFPAAHHAAVELQAWLWTRPETLDVHNVEDDPAYQKADVDLLWLTEKARYKIEIKADRLGHHTGNYFFETHSNQEKGTPGCFLYTEADLFFYYFTETRRLAILPMPATRAWFLPRQDQFPERKTTTPVRNGFYTTVGRLVPVSLVSQEVKGVWVATIPPGLVF
ncbi:MAG: hypothetical protein H6636_13515 [Anaerolineales bacterium]|nr:hypothetical protein [Anaerolineales bacterium]